MKDIVCFAGVHNLDWEVSIPQRWVHRQPCECGESDSRRRSEQISVHGILQARILEQVAMPFSRASSDPGTEPSYSPALAGRFFTTSATWEALKLTNIFTYTWKMPLYSRKGYRQLWAQKAKQNTHISMKKLKPMWVEQVSKNTV